MSRGPFRSRGFGSIGLTASQTLGSTRVGGGHNDILRRVMTKQGRVPSPGRNLNDSITETFSTTDVSGSNPTIPPTSLNADEALAGNWLVTATARLSADFLAVDVGELSVTIGGAGASRPGPFQTGSGSPATWSVAASSIVPSDAMYVAADFFSTVNLTLPDNAVGVELTLTATAVRLS